MFDNYTSRDIVSEYLTCYPHKTIEDTKGYLKNIVLPEYKNPTHIGGLLFGKQMIK